MNASAKSLDGNLERPLPQNADAERSVLGAILLDNLHLEVVRNKVKLEPEDFFDVRHRQIFRRMLKMRDDGSPIDLLTLQEALQSAAELDAAGGAGYLSSLVDGVPRKSNVEHYARIVKEKAILRGVIHVAQVVADDAFNAQDSSSVLVRFSLEAARLAADALPREDWRARFHTVDELPDGELQMPIADFLPEGVTFWGGSSENGKTWVGLSMARALTMGEPVFGKWPVRERCNVLYLVPEMGARTFRRRARRFGIGGELFRCLTLADGPAPDLNDPMLLIAIRELKPVVFLDTAIRFSTAKDENSASENARGLARAIFGLLHAGARAVVCLHHRAKDADRAEEMTLENTLRGSGDLGAICDAAYGVQFDRGDGSAAYFAESKALVRLSVRCVKARDFSRPEDFRVQLAPFIDEVGDMRIVAGPGEVARKSGAERLRQAITANPRASSTQLAKTLHISRNRIPQLAARDGWSLERGQGWVKR